MKQKYLFLYLKTGGGHISTAKALEKYFQKNHADTVDVVLADGFEEAHPIIKKIIVDGYAKAQSRAKRSYEFLYLLTKSYTGAKISQLMLALCTKTYLQKLIQKENPHKIVVFHFFLIKPVKQILKAMGIDIPVITVVTDPFTATRLWFLEKNMKYIVYSERAKKDAMSKGVPEKSITVLPVILDEKYASKVSPAEMHEIKKKLGFSQEKKIILLLGSGDGLPKGAQILKCLGKENIDAQVAIICGRDARLFASAQKIKGAHPHLNLKVYGFIDFVYEMIQIADIVITKGGPASILQILLLGKVPLVHTYLWEQEKGNVEFIVHNKVGVYQKNIKKLTSIVKDLLDGDLSSYQQNISKLQLKIGNTEIGEYIKKLEE